MLSFSIRAFQLSFVQVQGRRHHCPGPAFGILSDLAELGPTVWRPTVLLPLLPQHGIIRPKAQQAECVLTLLPGLKWASQKQVAVTLSRRESGPPKIVLHQGLPQPEVDSLPQGWSFSPATTEPWGSHLQYQIRLSGHHLRNITH